MQSERRGVIDIGTNSIKLLVADVADSDVTPFLEESRQTRLGQGFYETHCLQPERIEQTAQAVARFVEKAREHNTASIRIIATSAVREARNSDQLAGAIQKACGLPMEIISGEQEADLAFRGINTDRTLAGRPVLLLEVGGGSMQFILGHDEHPHFLESFPVGSVRLLEKLPHSDPPSAAELEACRAWLKKFLEKEVRPKLLPAIERERAAGKPAGTLQLVGTGGTASILGGMEARLEQFDRARLEAVQLNLDRLRWHVENLWQLPLEKRKHIIGLPKNRADIILTGAAIYEAVMCEFAFRQLRISTRGLRFGAVLEREKASTLRD
jgi:exopolyphosphatase/guanosine-5'-triphosphate,3'-diphosphate pyrophosphatase